LKNNWQNIWSGRGKPVPLQSQDWQGVAIGIVWHIGIFRRSIYIRCTFKYDISYLFWDCIRPKYLNL